MKTLLLVHGGWSASWVWDRLRPHLEERRVAYRCVDLPGHGSQRRSPWSVSLVDYGEAVAAAARGIEGPVLAVGHSMGGFVVSQAAGRAPEAFAGLVYLAAFLPRSGERLIRLARGDRGSQLPPALRYEPLRGRIRLDTARADAPLFHDCPAADREVGLASLEPNPMRPALARVELDERFEALPKHYVFCTRDRAISPEYQRWMAARTRLESAHELDCGHMPAYAAPAALADTLRTIAGSAPPTAA